MRQPICRAENVTEGIHTKMLRPYSLSLTLLISCLKANMKVDILHSQVQLQIHNRQAARNVQIQLGVFGEQILIAGGERNVPATTVLKCTAWC